MAANTLYATDGKIDTGIWIDLVEFRPPRGTGKRENVPSE